MLDESSVDAPFIHRIFGPKHMGPRVGQRAPEFRLPEARGGTITLHDILEDRHAVVVFYGGTGCPRCTRLLAALSEARGEFGEQGFEILAVGNERTRRMDELLGRIDIRFPLLLDRDNSVIAQYDLLERSRGLGAWLAHRTNVRPTVLLVDQQGTVRWMQPVHDRRRDPILVLPIARAARAICDTARAVSAAAEVSARQAPRKRYRRASATQFAPS